MTDRIVIVGGGLAAATAATELRKRGFDGSIRLLAAEPHAPYIRPPLSKGYLQGSEERGNRSSCIPTSGTARTRCSSAPRPGSTSIDRAARTVTLADGEVVAYDQLLLATGAEPRRLSIPGADADGIHYLRTIESSEAASGCPVGRIEAGRDRRSRLDRARDRRGRPRLRQRRRADRQREDPAGGAARRRTGHGLPAPARVARRALRARHRHRAASGSTTARSPASSSTAGSWMPIWSWWASARSRRPSSPPRRD